MSGGTSKTARKVVRAAFASTTPVRCEYCDRRLLWDMPLDDPRRATGDHRIPRCRSGPNQQWNIAVVCSPCNQAKGPLTTAEFMAVRHDPHELKRLKRFVSEMLRAASEEAA